MGGATYCCGGGIYEGGCSIVFLFMIANYWKGSFFFVFSCDIHYEFTQVLISFQRPSKWGGGSVGIFGEDPMFIHVQLFDELLKRKVIHDRWHCGYIR